METDWLTFIDPKTGPNIICKVDKIVWVRRFQNGLEIGYENNIKGYVPCTNEEMAIQFMEAICRTLQNKDLQK